MEWINSTATAVKGKMVKNPSRFTVNYAVIGGEILGGIVINKDRITWCTTDSGGTANSYGQAKLAVEKLVAITTKNRPCRASYSAVVLRHSDKQYTHTVSLFVDLVFADSVFETTPTKAKAAARRLLKNVRGK